MKMKPAPHPTVHDTPLTFLDKLKVLGAPDEFLPNQFVTVRARHRARVREEWTFADAWGSQRADLMLWILDRAGIAPTSDVVHLASQLVAEALDPLLAADGSRVAALTRSVLEVAPHAPVRAPHDVVKPVAALAAAIRTDTAAKHEMHAARAALALAAAEHPGRFDLLSALKAVALVGDAYESLEIASFLRIADDLRARYVQDAVSWRFDGAVGLELPAVDREAT